MQAIEFQTTVKKIMHAMPVEKRGELHSYTEDETVRVIVITPPHHAPRSETMLLDEARALGYSDFLDYLLDHPLSVSNPVRYSRDELHER